MHTHNNESSSVPLSAVMFLVTLAYVTFAFLSALAFFIAIVMTFVAFMAWRRPLELGRATVYPHEARAFVKRGVVGAFMLALFGVFLKEKMGIYLRPETLHYLFMGGYAVGSVGVELLFADYPRRPPPSEARPTPPPSVPVVVVTQRHMSATRRPFHYASWDDEDAGR